MPPRFAYWTIILDGTPTSFRAKEQDELLPTFNQLKKKNPGAIMKWFSGGRLWDSPDQARDIRAQERERIIAEARAQRVREEPQLDEKPRPTGPGMGAPRPHGGPRPHGAPHGPGAPRPHGAPHGPGSSHGPGAPRPRSARPPSGGAPRRTKEWRPGGEHRDPKDAYKLPPGEARKRWKRRNLGPRPPKSGSH